jgi:hypothetical protein
VASPELLRRLAQALDRLEIPYLLTGAVASTYWGEPRLTRDIDVVAQLRHDDVERLLGEFPAPEFYASVESAREAVQRQRQFNIIQPASGLKIDVIVAMMDPFDRSRFARRQRVDLGGFAGDISAPEDVILKKLVAFSEGGSEKHLRDAAGVLQISGSAVDREYIDDWSARLGVTEVWGVVRDAVSRRPRGEP